MSHRLVPTWVILAVVLIAGAVSGQEAVPPREVKVLPVFFVPKGEPPPTKDQTRRLLRHELGHSFGLPHVDVYGYDMKSNDSTMPYNPKHHTNGFEPSGTPGKLIPEDLRGLALDQRAFPTLRFDPEKDVPRGYTISAPVMILGPQKIPEQPDGVQITTGSGEEYGSKVANVVQGACSTSCAATMFGCERQAAVFTSR